MGQCFSTTTAKPDNKDVAEHGKKATVLLSTAASSLAGFLTLLNVLYIQDTQENQAARNSINDAIKVLNAIAATSGGLGQTFVTVGDFTLLSDVPDLNNDGVINWKDKLTSGVQDALSLAQSISDQMKVILEEFQANDLGSLDDKFRIQATIEAMQKVDSAITSIKNVLSMLGMFGMFAAQAAEDAQASEDSTYDMDVDEFIKVIAPATSKVSSPKKTLALG